MCLITLQYIPTLRNITIRQCNTFTTTSICSNIVQKNPLQLVSSYTYCFVIFMQTNSSALVSICFLLSVKWVELSKSPLDLLTCTKHQILAQSSVAATSEFFLPDNNEIVQNFLLDQLRL